MTFSPEQLAERRKSIGASDAGAIMAGEWAKLWQIKTGRVEPDDLSGVLPVQLGAFTEPFNRLWFTKQTGIEVTAAGEKCRHAELPFLTCTLDGRVKLDGGPAVFEAKHVGGREPMETLLLRYQPQLHHQMHVAGLEWAVLSVLSGNSGFEYAEVPLDPFYLADLVERERTFWRYVELDAPPPDMAPILAPVPPDKWRVVSMEGNNTWASGAVEWLANKLAAAAFKNAEKAIKELVEPDVGTAQGHGIQAKRNKAGSLTIKEWKAK